ncbi:MAG TPA: transketolase [Gemmatimonadaceae bacterium]|nr:transketolase [Gemmatimonadaceae bacterium]
MDIDQLAINTIRTLSMDAVQKAESGHPGTPMALAPLAYRLFTQHIKHDPSDPSWFDRDRFVLSAGHASMLLYSSLYLTGYGVTLDDLKQFRQWESKTPGHPEYGYTPGVETTTGPLGQGIANAVGMAMAEAHLAAVFNKPGQEIIDHHTWFICSDGDLMEGISHEAASFAGHFGLGKLIGFYDDNRITIDGSTTLSYSDDAQKRFEGYHWHVLRLDDVNDLGAIDRVVAQAKAERERPTLVITRTHIGYGSPNKQDTAKAHGEPLGKEEVILTKKNLGWPWPEESFKVPPEVLEHTRKAVEKGRKLSEEWRARFVAYPDAAELKRRIEGRLPDGWEKSIPAFTKENGAVASRAASNVVLNALVKVMPELIGGSADLTPSNGTALKDQKNFAPDCKAGRYVHFGIREHGMASIMNGLALHGGVRPFGATFLIFSDYMRPGVRLAAIMKQPVIFIYTHDSIGLGEDGPTHQPIEQLSTLRAIPEFTLIRPADAGETAEAWRVAIAHSNGPVALVFTRQKLGFIDREKYAPAQGLVLGAYVLADVAQGLEPQTPHPKPLSRPDVILMSCGSEVALVIAAHEKLAERGIKSRVVSMPSHELFARQDVKYRESVLPAGVPRIAVEAAHPMSWYRWVGDDGVILGLERYGASAPYEKIYEELGLTVDKVVSTAERLVKRG